MQNWIFFLSHIHFTFPSQFNYLEQPEPEPSEEAVSIRSCPSILLLRLYFPKKSFRLIYHSKVEIFLESKENNINKYILE